MQQQCALFQRIIATLSKICLWHWPLYKNCIICIHCCVQILTEQNKVQLCPKVWYISKHLIPAPIGMCN